MIFTDHKTYGDYRLKRNIYLAELAVELGITEFNDPEEAYEDNADTEWYCRKLLAGLPAHEEVGELYLTGEIDNHDCHAGPEDGCVCADPDRAYELGMQHLAEDEYTKGGENR